MSESAEKILFLGPVGSPLLEWLVAREPSVLQIEHPIGTSFIDTVNVTALVSYGYRHILEPAVLNKIPGAAVNLHMSLLPWNRGADPNLWSFVDGTPKGVTIHYLDKGIDTGDIIVQREIEFSALESQTLATTYRELDTLIQRLFHENWPAIRAGTCERYTQSGQGSFHTIADRKAVAEILTQGWDTPISALRQ